MLAGVPMLATEALTLNHPVVVFASVMVILLVAPLAFERLRVPGMVGLIAAGVALGPHGAGLFQNDATFGLLGTVGLLYLMFLAGLEINAAEFRANRVSSVVFGGLTFAIPMVAGTLLARRVLPGFSWPQAVLLASMFASHTLLPHPIAARLGLARHRAVVTTVGGTILTDTAALLVLAVVAETTRTQLTPLFLARQMFLLVAFVGLVLWGVPRIGYWFFRRVEPDGASEFVFVVAVVFVAALGALLTGVEAIIGAFLAGIALSSLVPEQGVLRNRLEFSGHALFIPFFLLKVGMLVDPGILLRGWGVWRVALFMCATVIATKWGAAALAARLLGYTRDEGRLVFGLSVNQAAATLAAVLVGCEIGLFDDAVLNGTIMMILATCILGPWVTERSGRKVAEVQRHVDTPWTPHAHRVLAAVGSPRTADRLLDLALLLATPGAGRIHALHVAQEGPAEEREIAEADRALAAAIVRGAGGGVDVEGVTRIAANPAQGIVRAARELRASVLVLGWAGHGVAHMFLFRSLLDRILAGSRSQTVVVGRWPHAVGTSRRMWVLVPPLVERQEGLEEGLQSLCTIALRAGGGPDGPCGRRRVRRPACGTGPGGGQADAVRGHLCAMGRCRVGCVSAIVGPGGAAIANSGVRTDADAARTLADALRGNRPAGLERNDARGRVRAAGALAGCHARRRGGTDRAAAQRPRRAGSGRAAGAYACVGNRRSAGAVGRWYGDCCGRQPACESARVPGQPLFGPSRAALGDPGRRGSDGAATGTRRRRGNGGGRTRSARGAEMTTRGANVSRRYATYGTGTPRSRQPGPASCRASPRGLRPRGLTGKRCRRSPPAPREMRAVASDRTPWGYAPPPPGLPCSAMIKAARAKPG